MASCTKNENGPLPVKESETERRTNQANQRRCNKLFFNKIPTKIFKLYIYT